MKRRLMALLVSLAVLVTLVAPVAGTIASELTTPAPATEAPATETPATEVPATKVPATEVPATEVPATEVPATEVPATEEPAVVNEISSTEVPATEVPATEVPATEVPATEVPVTEVPATEVPATEVPATEVPATEAPATEVPATEEPESTDVPESTDEPESTEVPETTAEPTEAPDDMTVELYANQRSAFEGETVSANAAISGGAAPYTVYTSASISGGAAEKSEFVLEAAGSVELKVYATYGEANFYIKVTDANGYVREASAKTPVAVNKTEEMAYWEDTIDVKLSGDWAEDLIAVAKSQLGYEESKVNFIVREDGSRQGYTRYGDWYGMPYEEWCAMFVSFCLHYAQIPEWAYPQDSGCEKYIAKLKSAGAYEDAGEYMPQRGDLVFFNWDEEADSDHVGIVENVTESTIETIEGNAGGKVQRRVYSLSDDDIMGYANTAYLCSLANPETEEPQPEEVPEVTDEPTEETCGCVDAEGNLVCDETCECACHVETLLCMCVDTDGNRVCEEGCECACHAEEIPEEPEIAEGTVLAQPENAAWESGLAEISLSFSVEGAASYVWQRGQAGEWEEIPESNSSNYLLSATIENMKYAYRCEATTVSGAVITSAEITLVDAELVQWLNAGEVDMEMLDRAMNAKSLESLVIEGDQLVYVRTGESVAFYNAETGELIDNRFNLTVATVDTANGMIYPVVGEPMATTESADAADAA